MNKNNIADAAIKLEELLKKYSESVPEAQEVFDSCRALLNKAKSKELTAPVAGGWFHINLEPGFPLAEIDDLSQAAAEFSILLEGWDSLEEFRRDFSEIEKQGNQDEAEIRK